MDSEVPSTRMLPSRPPVFCRASGTIGRAMDVVPITLGTVLQLVAMTLLAVTPLLLTMISLEELLRRLMRVVTDINDVRPGSRREAACFVLKRLTTN